MSLIIGVDGGGTKSTYIAFNTATLKLKEYCGDSINFYSVGNEKASKSFLSVIKVIKQDFNANISSILVGNAALGIGKNLDFEHPFSQAVSSTAEKFDIKSDLYIGLKGVNFSPSMFLISGTGSMGIAEDKTGELFTIGGWGYLLGDQGSGYYIGINGIREAIKAYEGITSPSILVNSALNHFNIKVLGEIIEVIYAKEIENKHIANFAVEVHRAAAQGDKAAKVILENSIDYLTKCIVVLNDKIGKKKAKLGVYGGNFQKSQHFFNNFKRKLLNLCPNIEIGFPEYSPVQSALILAGKLIDLDITERIKKLTLKGVTDVKY